MASAIRALQPLVRPARSYASKASFALNQSLEVQPSLPSQPPAGSAPVTTVSTLKNGVKVATYENFAPKSSVAVIVQAGSRYEDSKTLGAAQFLKHFGLQSTHNHTHVGLTRTVEVIGGDVVTSLTRENVVYSAQCIRADVAETLNLVADVATQNKFYDYEVHDVAHIIETESATALANPKVTVFEGLHRAAFRGTLGNPLYASDSTAHHITASTLKAYAAKSLNPAQVTVVGAGVNHSDLVAAAAGVLEKLNGAATTPAAAKYIGGDLHIENVSDPVNIYALAFEGASYSSPEFAPLLVLGKILGGGKHIKYGSGVSVLAKAVAKFGHGTTLSAFNISYSDSGLFGVYVESSADKLNSAVETGVAELKKTATAISAEDLARGKAQAQFTVASSYESNAGAIDNIALQASGSYKSSADLVAAIEKVTAADVSAAAKKLFKSKPSAVAYGDVVNAPFAASFQF